MGIVLKYLKYFLFGNSVDIMVEYKIRRLIFNLSQINREEVIGVMKEYNFPYIFQNIVGQVIPSCVFQPRDPFIEIDRRSNENEKLQMNINASKNQIQSRNQLKVKSFKKELSRRSKCFQTMKCFTNRNIQKNIENLRQTQVSSKFSNYLKKNTNLKVIIKQKNNTNQNKLRLSSQIEHHSIKQSENNYFHSKNRNGQRIRTSLENNENMYQILKTECSPDSKVNLIICKKQEDSNSKLQTIKAMNEINQIEKQSITQLANIVIKEKLRKRIQKNIKRSSFKQIDQMRKKTVNFIISSQEIASDSNEKEANRKQENKQPRSIIKKSDIYKINKTNSNYNKRSNKSNKSKSFNDKQSEWTARSVVSIKFTDNDSVKQHKSLRSEQSILNSQASMKLKSNKIFITKTFKHINLVKKAMNLKRHKSQNKAIQKMWESSQKQALNNKKNSTKLLEKSHKSVKSINLTSRKNLTKEKKRNGPRVSLLRKIEPLSVGDEIFDGCNSVTLKDSTFQAQVYKKNNSKKLMKQMRSDDQNVFHELNNFHKFLKENEVIDSEREIKKAFTKPIVIPDETNYRTYRVSKTSVTNQNLFFDMGLQLIKKMNVLAQKRI